MARIHESHGRQLALCMLYGASDSCPFHLYSFDTWTQIFDLHEEIIAGIIDTFSPEAISPLTTFGLHSSGGFALM